MLNTMATNYHRLSNMQSIESAMLEVSEGKVNHLEVNGKKVNIALACWMRASIH